jgi:hypothetical protein
MVQVADDMGGALALAGKTRVEHAALAVSVNEARAEQSVLAVSVSESLHVRNVGHAICVQALPSTSSRLSFVMVRAFALSRHKLRGLKAQ